MYILHQRPLCNHQHNVQYLPSPPRLLFCPHGFHLVRPTSLPAGWSDSVQSVQNKRPFCQQTSQQPSTSMSIQNMPSTHPRSHVDRVAPRRQNQPDRMRSPSSQVESPPAISSTWLNLGRDCCGPRTPSPLSPWPSQSITKDLIRAVLPPFIKVTPYTVASGLIRSGNTLCSYSCSRRKYRKSPACGGEWRSSVWSYRSSRSAGRVEANSLTALSNAGAPSFVDDG